MAGTVTRRRRPPRGLAPENRGPLPRPARVGAGCLLRCGQPYVAALPRARPKDPQVTGATGRTRATGAGRLHDPALGQGDGPEPRAPGRRPLPRTATTVAGGIGRSPICAGAVQSPGDELGLERPRLTWPQRSRPAAHRPSRSPPGGRRPPRPRRARTGTGRGSGARRRARRAPRPPARRRPRRRPRPRPHVGDESANAAPSRRLRARRRSSGQGDVAQVAGEPDLREHGDGDHEHRRAVASASTAGCAGRRGPGRASSTASTPPT